MPYSMSYAESASCLSSGWRFSLRSIIRNADMYGRSVIRRYRRSIADTVTVLARSCCAIIGVRKSFYELLLARNGIRTP